MKKKLLLIALIVVIFFLLITKTTFFTPVIIRIFGSQTKLIPNEATKKENKALLFIHGYDGSSWTFFTTTIRYSFYNIGTRSLILTVKEDGAITTKGIYSDKMKHPMIRIEFENAKASIDENAEFLEKALAYLKKKYHIDQADVIAHSYGGLTYTAFLEKYSGDDYPLVKKFVAIGSPFNGSEVSKNGITPYDLGTDGPKKESEHFKSLLKESEKIPKNLSFLNIIGDLNNGSRSDGAVAVDSALSARYIFSEQEYKEKIFYGLFAQHSLLHLNPHVDREILKFLYPDK